jgi:hypothetical protein
MTPAQTQMSGQCTGVAFPVHHHYLNRTGECVPKCGADILFKADDKHFAMVRPQSFSFCFSFFS